MRRFFRRAQDAAAEVEADWDPLPFPTISPLVWRPIAAGLWRQCEADDGTYDVDDLMDALEFLDVKEENQRRYDAWLEASRKAD